MIGDREHDMLGAKHCNIPRLGVLWGYGSKKELEDSGASICIESPKELRNAILTVATQYPDAHVG